MNTITTTINGERHTLEVSSTESLLTMLRDRVQLTGSKGACLQGECGSCSVWLDGALVCSCLILAAQVHGRTVRTIEAVGGDRPHPVQDCLVGAGGVQCGYCTPGFVVAIVDLLERDPAPSDSDIREALSGNLCRCTGYEKILAAVREAARELGP